MFTKRKQTHQVSLLPADLASAGGRPRGDGCSGAGPFVSALAAACGLRRDSWGPKALSHLADGGEGLRHAAEGGLVEFVRLVLIELDDGVPQLVGDAVKLVADDGIDVDGGLGVVALGKVGVLWRRVVGRLGNVRLSRLALSLGDVAGKARRGAARDAALVVAAASRGGLVAVEVSKKARAHAPHFREDEPALGQSRRRRVAPAARR